MIVSFRPATSPWFTTHMNLMNPSTRHAINISSCLSFHIQTTIERVDYLLTVSTLWLCIDAYHLQTQALVASVHKMQQQSIEFMRIIAVMWDIFVGYSYRQLSSRSPSIEENGVAIKIVFWDMSGRAELTTCLIKRNMKKSRNWESLNVWHALLMLKLWI
jgi:hypothetical protein